MDVLLVGLNAKYIHTNLAIRNIVRYCDDPNISFYEATINDDMDAVLEDIIAKSADVVGFSCYIWNIEEVLSLVENIKKLRPKTLVVLGGPEVSYDVVKLLSKNPGIDCVIVGEGEEAFLHNNIALRGEGALEEVGGLVFRKGDKICENPPGPPLDLNKIPLSYDEKEDLDHKLVYYETSRGCHFRCAFCLSSLDTGVRVADLDKVEEDLRFFTEKQVRTVKLVDRSFNCNLPRAKALFDIIRRLPGKTVFHCEVNPELVNEEFIKALEGLQDRLQFEVGVQSTYPKTLKAISRTPDVARTLKGIELMQKAGLKLHVDLIAGLPYEDFNTFGKSFDDVYRLGPQEIQLGFLKMLKGTRLTAEASNFGIRYRSKPPYEILYNDYISYDELCVLKGIAHLVEKYHNSSRFMVTLDHFLKGFDSPFSFYCSLYRYWKDMGLFRERHSLKTLYDLLFSYGKHLGEVEGLLRDLLKFDFLYSMGKDALPESLKGRETPEFYQSAKALVKDEQWRRKNLPIASELSWSEISRHLVFGLFQYDVLGTKNPKEHGIMFLSWDGKTHYAPFDI